jgi:2-(1,2-epoxy-1,2-dihydrophenyl)acetyl-CoA isomerase
MSEQPVHVSNEDAVGTIEFNRPEAMNALDIATKKALLAALKVLGSDKSVRCVVLTGSGRAFSAGQDLKEHAQLLAQGDLGTLWSTVPDHYNPIASAIHTLDKPILAAVNGVAAGAAAALAFLTDYRILASSAAINVAFAGIGLSCDTGTSWTLQRLVGPTRAMDLLLNPRTISATEALGWGIASEVVEDSAFRARVEEVANRLAHGPTLAYASIRRAVAFSASHSLAQSLEFEGELMRLTGSSQDHRAAVEAFLAKQRPTFTGN